MIKKENISLRIKEIYDLGFIHEEWPEHCIESVWIRNFSGPYFPTFGLNTERYRVSLKKETLVQMFSGESCEIS